MDDIRDLSTGKMGTSLLALLSGAVKNLDNGDPGGAVDKLSSFIAKVNAQAGKKLNATDAAYLVGQAQHISDAIQPPPLVIGWGPRWCGRLRQPSQPLTLQWPTARSGSTASPACTDRPQASRQSSAQGPWARHQPTPAGYGFPPSSTWTRRTTTSSKLSCPAPTSGRAPAPTSTSTGTDGRRNDPHLRRSCGTSAGQLRHGPSRHSDRQLRTLIVNLASGGPGRRLAPGHGCACPCSRGHFKASLPRLRFTVDGGDNDSLSRQSVDAPASAVTFRHRPGPPLVSSCGRVSWCGVRAALGRRRDGLRSPTLPAWGACR